jgi:hypothetical protein
VTFGRSRDDWVFALRGVEIDLGFFGRPCVLGIGFASGGRELKVAVGLFGRSRFVLNVHNF